MSTKLLTAIFALAFILFTACKKVDIAFGGEYIENDNTRIVKVDSFTVDLTTVQLDSFATSNKGLGLVGEYTDPYFGNTKTATYVQVGPPAYTDTYQNTTFDSVVLVVKLTKHYAGDTIQPITLNVERVAQDILFEEGRSAFYNVNSYPVSDVLGTKTMHIAPRRDDSLTVRLDQNLGKTFFDMLQRKSDTVTTTTTFTSFFKGLKISSGAGAAFAFGIKDSIQMRIYYSKPGALGVESKYVNFSTVNQDKLFYSVVTNRAGTSLATLQAQTYLNSTLTTPDMKNAVYLQPTAGTMVKVKFPSLRALLNTAGYRKILKAQLIVKPVNGTFDNNGFQLPPLLKLSNTNALNQIGTDISQLSSTGQLVTQTGDLQIDYQYGLNTNYVYDLTAYLKAALTSETAINNGLLLIPTSPNFETTLNRIVIGDKFNKQGKTELQIYYAAIQ